MKRAAIAVALGLAFGGAQAWSLVDNSKSVNVWESHTHVHVPAPVHRVVAAPEPDHARVRLIAAYLRCRESMQRGYGCDVRSEEAAFEAPYYARGVEPPKIPIVEKIKAEYAEGTRALLEAQAESARLAQAQLAERQRIADDQAAARAIVAAREAHTRYTLNAMITCREAFDISDRCKAIKQEVRDMGYTITWTGKIAGVEF